jgi:hypothetical protein
MIASPETLSQLVWHIFRFDSCPNFIQPSVMVELTNEGVSLDLGMQ